MDQDVLPAVQRLARAFEQAQETTLKVRDTLYNAEQDAAALWNRGVDDREFGIAIAKFVGSKMEGQFKNFVRRWGNKIDDLIGKGLSPIKALMNKAGRFVPAAGAMFSKTKGVLSKVGKLLPGTLWNTLNIAVNYATSKYKGRAELISQIFSESVQAAMALNPGGAFTIAADGVVQISFTAASWASAKLGNPELAASMERFAEQISLSENLAQIGRTGIAIDNQLEELTKKHTYDTLARAIERTDSHPVIKGLAKMLAFGYSKF